MLKYMMTWSEVVFDYVEVIRPLSLTCAIIATLVTTAVVNNGDIKSFYNQRFFIAITMAISVQLAANLTNTYFDYVNGIDVVDRRQKQYRLDRALANGRVSPWSIMALMVLFYSISIACVVPVIVNSNGNTLAWIFASGVLLAFFYTANPLGIGGLKYIALGDICIFLCFGPLLMQCVSVLLTGTTNKSLSLYCVPIGLLTEAILHANNSRDIKTDIQAGAITLAGILGFDRSYYFYITLFIGAYTVTMYIAMFNNWGCVLTLLTIPIAIDRVRKFYCREMDCLPQLTSKLHLPFGVLFFVGIMTTRSGIMSLVWDCVITNAPVTAIPTLLTQQSQQFIRCHLWKHFDFRWGNGHMHRDTTLQLIFNSFFAIYSFLWSGNVVFKESVIKIPQFKFNLNSHRFKAHLSVTTCPPHGRVTAKFATAYN